MIKRARVWTALVAAGFVMSAPASAAQLGQGGSPVPGKPISGGVTGGAMLKM